ncbi:Multidrug/Oligosaccharidyl-lipid/Polysaccharide (MOP) Flippase Superfamily [Achlya hypogyna]|uniref:Multidrug/Oligosaccharidyl-lipid/Polysaccharide (MOP) Flippase Superfamily n=1 Tax=Achlya hypogyna TaxID=1202772 RepID=A0A1V9ZHY2_ACHHY|nr:Multidrug/Oligosaccharidyl-lipid/Polysaccharide (MOP) Flippase Superfamily [Achlya hypogyna]
MEDTRLLASAPPTAYDATDLEKAPTEAPASPREELVPLLQLAWPMFASFAMEMLPGFLSVALVGHIESPHTKEFVDAATLSTVFLNVSGLSVGLGLASAMDTLCAQSVGAGKSHLLGIYLQSGIIVLSLAYVPMVLLNWHTTYFLDALGQDATVSALAGNFSRVTVLCLPSLFCYELLKKVMQAQEVVDVMVFIAAASNVVYVGVGYYLCYHTSLGFLGAAYARLVSNFVMPLLVLPYLAWNPVHRTWWAEGETLGTQWRAALAHVSEFIVFGVPGMLMMLMEWWAFEIVALMAGWMADPVLSLSVHSVLVNLVSVLYSVFFGISEAATIRIGTALGANEPARAKAIAVAAFVAAFGSALGVAGILLCTHNVLPALFINDPAAIAQTQRMLFFFAMFELVDGSNCIAQGLLRGMGRQSIGAFVNAMAYYAVGIPVAAVAGFAWHMDIEGLWLGITFGISTACVVFVYTIFRTDWRTMADNAAERMAE